ncbi:MAG: hypothetical protein IPO83_17835 [Chitinophagaceae bacterium]|nr:hypothetical protein [Chitinophagaceae bacterium]
MKITKLIFLFGLLAVMLLASFDDPEFPKLPKIKSIIEWRAWADTTKYKEAKWMKSKREYYMNGELSTTLFFGSKGDTTDLRIYKLNKDSSLKMEIWYNKFLKKWMDGDTYYYNKGETLPFMSKDNDKYKCFYTYDNQGNIIGKRLSDDKDENFAEYEYTYDTTGLLIQQVEFDFFDGQRDMKRIYVYEYEKNETGQVLKMDAFFVPHHTNESVTRTDKQGNQKTTYYGFTAKAKTNTETIYYNDKGERTQKIEYDRDNKPQFIWTYDYAYYY